MARRKRKIDPADMTLDQAYGYCQLLEKDRERNRKRYAQGYFEGDVVHFDMEELESRELDKVKSWLSDGGKSAEEMYAYLDGECESKPESYYNRRINAARMFVLRNCPQCYDTFKLIVKNGSSLVCVDE